MQVSRRQACSSLATLFALPACSWLGGSRPGPSPGPDDPQGDDDPFLAAVCRGDRQQVHTMLAADRQLAGTRDAAGRSALVLAFLHGHERIAARLLAAGIELDIVEAVLAEDWDRFEQLRTAHPERMLALHPIGGTPLHAAALVGSLDLWRLRGHGCAPDFVPGGGNGFTAARTAMLSADPRWARIALTDLCSNGADVNARQAGGRSILHGAVERRDTVLVRLAIRKGARVDALDDHGRTAAELAGELGWAGGAALLAQADRLPRDNRSSRFALDANRQPVVPADLSDVPQALQSTVTGSSHFAFDKVRDLLAADARLTFSVSSDDELAIEACAHTGHHDLMRLHLDHGAPLSLPTAVSLADADSVRFWLARDPSLVHERGAHDFPLLHYAVLGGGSVAMAELLHEHGASLDQESAGTTALHWCVRRDDRELARWLIEQGADPEPVGFRWHRAGQTPLQVAFADDREPMVALLRECGARR